MNALSEDINSIVTRETENLNRIISEHEQGIDGRLAGYRAEKQKELILAAAVGATSKIEGLIKEGAKPNAKSLLNPSSICYPLDYAIINLNPETVAELIRLGANVYSPDALDNAKKKARFYKRDTAHANLQKIAEMLETLHPGRAPSVSTLALTP
jgi:hypothetical protein